MCIAIWHTAKKSRRIKMAYITENLKTEIKDTCEVLVAGGGFAGISAALAAARNGAKVTLIEREYILGGLGTAGLITIYLPLCDGMGNQVSFGIAEELFRLSIKHGAENNYPKAWLDGGTEEEKAKQRFEVQYNPHLFALAAEKLLAENGVKILYGTAVTAVCTDNSKINAVIVENKSGRYAVGVSRSVVDCTGDADICKLSGAKTVNFSQGNILAAWHYYMASGNLRLRMKGASDVPDKYKTSKTQALVDRRFSGLDGEELSEMVALSHGKLYEDILEFKEKDPSHVPVTIPTIPQIRMTRRIDGAYTLDDTEMHKDFADSVGMFGDWRKRGPVYKLPFSTLYGRDVKNLICAGRCISVTDAMWDITRVIPVCAVSGEAAGTAAAMSDDFANIDIKFLQKKLTDAGVRGCASGNSAADFIRT